MNTGTYGYLVMVLGLLTLLGAVAMQGCVPASERGEEIGLSERGQEIDLYDAQRQGLVVATVQGAGLSAVTVSLRRTGGEPLRVLIPVGTYFVCTGQAQNMVSRSPVVVALLDNATAEASVSACCANLHLDEPSDLNTFSVRPSAPYSELRRVMEAIDSEYPSEVVAQVAVWAVTDNPT